MSSAESSIAPDRSLRDRIEPYLAIIGPLVMILLIAGFMAIFEPARYFRLSNLEIILLESALYMPMAMAMTFVITQRGIDLSIGSVAALSAIIMAYLVKQFGLPAWIGVTLAVVIGATMGLINGLVITRFRVPDLIGTLAMDLVYRGFALVLAKGYVLARFPELITDIGRGQIPGFVPIPVVIGVATLLAGYVLLTRTWFGRYTVAIGSNPEAAAMTGIAVDRHKIYAYVLMGAMAGLAGVMLTGKLNAGAGHFRAVLQPARHRRGGGGRHVAVRRPRLHARLVRWRAAAVDDDQRTRHAAHRVLLAIGGLGRRHHRLGCHVRMDSEEGSRQRRWPLGAAWRSRQSQAARFEWRTDRHVAGTARRGLRARRRSEPQRLNDTGKTPVATTCPPMLRRRTTMTLRITRLAAIGLAAVALPLQAAQLPLKTLPDDAKRDHWLPEQVNKPGTVEALQAATGGEAVKFTGTLDKPVRIALIYPSADVSDFWARNYLALTKRLDQLGIAHETTEFASRQIEHSLQATYTNQVVQDADLYDYVIFGPSELATQADNIDKLAGTKDFVSYVWAFHTPLKDLKNQPAVWFDFSSAYGAQVICKYMLERLGENVTFALNRGIPGVTDNQRSGDFKDCVVEKGGWKMAYEHYGEYQRAGGFEGTNLIMQAYPEATVIHNANTAMSMGSVEAQVAAGKAKDIFSTGWGGTGLELDAIRRGELDATPMRMGDDVGAATAEAIKANLEGRDAELPLVFLGRITVAHDNLSKDEIDALEKEAFRFSGVGALKR